LSIYSAPCNDHNAISCRATSRHGLFTSSGHEHAKTPCRASYVRVSLALELESTIAERAKANQIEAGKDHGKGLEKSPKAIEPINTRAEIAKTAGVSEDTVAKVKIIAATTAKMNER